MHIKENQFLSSYTTSKIGGKVRWVLFPENLDELFSAIWFCTFNRLPFFILGGGSNTIFQDKSLNFRQAVIHLGFLDKVALLENDSDKSKILEVEAGTSLQRLVDLAQSHHLSGLAALNRIPGTVGGAVLGNAGAYGVEIGELVEKVQVLNLTLLVRTFHKLSPKFFKTNSNIENMREAKAEVLFQFPDEFKSRFMNIVDKSESDFSYRSSAFKTAGNLIISKIWFNLKVQPDFHLEKAKYQEIAILRDKIYPSGLASPGSVFKNLLVNNLSTIELSKINPDWIIHKNKLPVGRLLEEVGARGFRVGQMAMRKTHANILINLGGGKFSQVESMIQNLQFKVEDRFGLKIEPEIRLVPNNFQDF
jgi:UDP-N-acetylmuramate dehydrogenase